MRSNAPSFGDSSSSRLPALSACAQQTSSTELIGDAPAYNEKDWRLLVGEKRDKCEKKYLPKKGERDISGFIIQCGSHRSALSKAELVWLKLYTYIYLI